MTNCSINKNTLNSVHDAGLLSVGLIDINDLGDMRDQAVNCDIIVSNTVDELSEAIELYVRSALPGKRELKIIEEKIEIINTFSSAGAILRKYLNVVWPPEVQ